jgi:hypothetical protein
MAKKKRPVAKNTPSRETSVPRAKVSPTPRAAAQPNAALPPRLKLRIPPKSVEKAKSAFSNFTLSKFAGNAPPPNYVTAKRSLAAVQKQAISNAIDTLQSSTPNRAITLALPSADVKKLLPSFDAKSGSVQLSDVLGLVQQRMSGTEFFARGNPTLNRLAVEATAQQILDSFMKDLKK